MSEVLFAGIRSVTLLLDPDAVYSIPETSVYLNGKFTTKVNQTVISVFDLLPDTDYTVTFDHSYAPVSFHTQKESVTLNVRSFGAVGDGNHDDTAAIQAAISCCPPKGRVLIPEGKYRITPLFLKSHIFVEIADKAVMLLETDRTRFPILPGMVQTTDELDDVNFGSWEGNPLDAFASLLTGISIEDVVVYGNGCLDGQGDLGDWWVNPKVKQMAFRPRMLFLNHCRDMVFQGFHVRRSPAWNLHPYFSDNLDFFNLSVNAPFNSPNTDGFDPESCKNVRAFGIHFSVGDDCIAIKSGKIYMGNRYKTACENLEIAHCLMENGHGGVTVGSEMAGGVHHVRIHHCEMSHTDRGLRIKTRRGRGIQGRIDDIAMQYVKMEHVKVPLAVNSMYYCDPDGHSAYVQDRNSLPVDERTPSIGSLLMDHVTADHATNAGYVLGLPEKPVENLTIRSTEIHLDENADPIACIMADGIDATCGESLILENVDKTELDLCVTGHKGPAVKVMEAK